jgi:hypothetical protein
LKGPLLSSQCQNNLEYQVPVDQQAAEKEETQDPDDIASLVLALKLVAAHLV